MKVCSVCHRCFDDTVFSCIEHNDTELSSIRPGQPEMITGYSLERLIERGGIDETYLAHHLKSDRVCLIKIFDGSSDRREQFLRDAETASSIFDPALAGVYETGGLEDGDLYLVTEQLPGRSLREILKEHGTMELLTAVSIIRQTAEAVHSLHLKGIIHRAIRPENIVVSDDNAVRLANIDFGGLIEHSITSDKFTIDTFVDELRYFAPEQFSGRGHSIKSDVYSLGVVFYEMLTGQPPFEATTAVALIEMHRSHRPTDVKIDDFDLRMLITHSLMESLNKHPENRQSSANAFARQLRHVEQLATHVSTPPPAVHLTPRPVRTAVETGQFSPARKVEAAVSDQGPPLPEVTRYEPVFHEASLQFKEESPVAASPVTPEPATMEFSEPSVTPLPIETVAEHAALPTESRLNRFRRRLKRHRHEHVVDSAPQKEVPIENDIPEPVEELPVVVSIEMPPQEIEVEAPIQATPTQLEHPETDDEKIPYPVEIPEPIPAPVIRQPKDIVITNPRKLGMRDIFSAPAPGTSHHEPDEITAATARSRPIRIPVEGQKPSHVAAALFRSSVDNLFFPTLFGSSTAIASDERSSMFSSFHGEATKGNFIVRRVIKAGGLAIAIASLVLIGKQFTGELRSEAAPVVNNSMPAASAPVPQPIAEVQNLRQRISEVTSANLSATNDKVSKPPTPVKTSTDAEAARSHSSFSDNKDSSPLDPTRSGSSMGSRTSKPAKAEAAKTDSRSQPIMRSARADTGSRSLTRTANKPIAQNKPGATTRPRIVANPRP